MRTITFRPDKSVHLKKGQVVQNLMIAVDEEQSHFLKIMIRVIQYEIS